MSGSLIQALIFVIDVFAGLYLLLLLLRFLIPWLRIDFRDPLAQGILKLTSPVVIPVRRFLPAIGRVDTATIVVAFVIQYLVVMIIFLLVGAPVVSALAIAVESVFRLLGLIVNIFMFGILLSIILSWIAPNSHNPAVGIVRAIADPVLRPFRRVIPPMGGFDISPIFALVALGVVRILLNGMREETLLVVGRLLA